MLADDNIVSQRKSWNRQRKIANADKDTSAVNVYTRGIYNPIAYSNRVQSSALFFA
jgi:hypothetical protein